MRHFCALIIYTVASIPAFAQTISGPAITPDNRVIYNLTAIPPVVSNNRVLYSLGTAYTDGYGKLRVCDGILTIEGRGRSRAQCQSTSAPIAPTPNISAESFSTLAPAAGEPQSNSLFKDSDLSSDSSKGLQNDKAMVKMRD